MKRHIAVLWSFSCVLAAPLVAQTTIGGNPCNSASVKGPYSVSITGRQVTTAGVFTSVYQANGTATFDGLSAVTMALTVDSNQSVASSVTWSGTYSLQSNCVGVVTITSGGTATFNLAVFNNGVAAGNLAANFVLTGNDATYSYSANGNVQPTGCSAALFTGIYTFNATGFTLSGTSVNGAAAVVGLLTFDGQSHVTANLTFSPTNSNASTLTGSYSVSSNCLGSATLSDGKGGSYVMSFSVEDNTPVTSPLYSSTIFVGLAQNGKFIVTGAAHAIQNQPTSTATAAIRGLAAQGGRS